MMYKMMDVCNLYILMERYKELSKNKKPATLNVAGFSIRLTTDL